MPPTPKIPEFLAPKYIPSARFSLALELATALHARQQRKRTGVPYVAHLLDVCSIVMQADGDEEQAIAALLHDAPEDQGGYETLHMIRRLFGKRVSTIVKDCTDSYDGHDDQLHWRERKAVHVTHFREHALSESCLVYAADKLANSRSMLRDLRRYGSDVWQLFSGGREGTLWYLEAMSQTFRERVGDTAMTRVPGNVTEVLDELDRSIAEMKSY
ncbi:MAG: HD domain-containing protein [Acidobacteriaceae bacterium]